MDEPFWETHLIYKVIAGSQAYGLETEQSDLDVRGVCIPPRRYLLGLGVFEQWENQDPEGDTVIYALTKFVRLALVCNPNIIELLYTDPRHVLFVNDHGRRLLERRHLFLSRLARQTFAGYAISQLRRIERHHRWLVDPPDHQPTQEEYGGWLADARPKFPDHQAHGAYQAALKHWNHYQTWRRRRNPARAELERRYGYDTKHAMHLFRLLKMGAEILETGQVHVYRPDRDWLRAVREGLLSYEEVLDLAAAYEARLEAVAERSPLPEEPDFEAAEALLIEMQERFLWETRAQANEVCAVLVGQRTDHDWSGSLRQLQEGRPASARFDWAWVLAREEDEGDVIGFYHTHPGGAAAPSQRDLRTMRAWVTCFGKPLLCLIEGGAGLAAYLFETDEDDGQKLPEALCLGDQIVAKI
jgi:predicted nucleotidyltransferase